MNKIIAVILAVVAFFFISGLDVLSYPELGAAIENPYISAIAPQEGASRALLDDAQKQLYDIVKGGLLSYQTEIEIKRYSYDNEDLKKVIWCIMQDNPEFFWLDWADWNLREAPGGQGVILLPTYLYAVSDIEAMQATFEAACTAITDAAAQADAVTDYEIALFLHNYLIAHVKYEEEGENIHSAYSTIVDGVAVCDGYTRAYQILLRKMDVESMYVQGRIAESDPGVGHAWNIVNINGVYCHVDVTWDDLDPDYPSSWKYELPLSYSHFLLSDDEMFVDHIQDNPFDLPVCEGYGYFEKLELQGEKFPDISANVEKALWSNIQKGMFYVEFKITDKIEYQRVVNDTGKVITQLCDAINVRLMNEKAKFKIEPSQYSLSETMDCILLELKPGLPDWKTT